MHVLEECAHIYGCIVVTELSFALDAMFSRFLLTFPCVSMWSVCACVHVLNVWGEVYAFIISFEFVSYADRNEDMFQLIFFLFSMDSICTGKKHTSVRDDPIKK